MPNYDFKCSVCGGIQEVYKAFGDDSLPVCCQESMTKIYSSPPGVQFKGFGFYKTDSR
jgi:putative FmdB family regulatory protein